MFHRLVISPDPDCVLPPVVPLPPPAPPGPQGDGSTSMEKSDSTAAGTAPTVVFPRTGTEQSMPMRIEEGPVAANNVLPINAVPENKPELSGYISPEDGLEQANYVLDATGPAVGMEEGSVAADDVPINAVPESKPELSGYVSPDDGLDLAADVLDGTEHNEVAPATTDEATGGTAGELSAAAVAMPVAVGSVAALVSGLEDGSPLATDEEASALGLGGPPQSAAYESIPTAASVQVSEAAAPPVHEMASADTPEALEETAAAAPTELEATTAIIEEGPEEERMDQVAATVEEASMKDTVEVSLIDKTFGVKVGASLHPAAVFRCSFSLSVS